MHTLHRLSFQLLAIITLSGALAGPAAAQAPRGPSTPDERARVSALADAARKDPLGVQAANAAWFEQWVSDVPDYTFKPEAVAKWCMRAAKGDMKKILQFQFGVSALSYQVQHQLPDPSTEADKAAVNLAALDGVLAAYEALLAKDEANRSPKMDQAVARRNKGELAAFASEIAQ